MTKRALCVGVNPYSCAPERSLNGCVNDANAWADLLESRFDFGGNVTRLVNKPTRDEIVGHLHGLVRGAKSADTLVFVISSHGSCKGLGGGRYNQTMVPYDCRHLFDYEFRNLFAELEEGIHMAVIADTCFSGTVTRFAFDESAAPVAPGTAPAAQSTLRVRFLNPVDSGASWLPPPHAFTIDEEYPESEMKEILLSACTYLQYAKEDEFDGVSHGVLTHFALQAIGNALGHPTYEQLHKALEPVGYTKYQQDPQLEGQEANKKKPIFS